MSASVTLVGIDDLKRQLDRVPDVVRAQSSGAVAGTVSALESKIRGLVPVASGTLRESIRAVSGGISIGSPYWRFVEYGTRHMSAQPFVRPAVESERGLFVERMKAIGPVIERQLSALT